MKPHAIDFGVASRDYSGMTLEEIIDEVESGKRRRIADLKEKAQMDYKMAQLNAFAMNDPKKMPKLEEHYGFLKEFDKYDVQLLKDGRPVERRNVNEPQEPEKPEWMIHKEIMAQKHMSINQKFNEKERLNGGG